VDFLGTHMIILVLFFRKPGVTVEVADNFGTLPLSLSLTPYYIARARIGVKLFSSCYMVFSCVVYAK
jgi:hypothetical protein